MRFINVVVVVLGLVVAVGGALAMTLGSALPAHAQTPEQSAPADDFPRPQLPDDPRDLAQLPDIGANIDQFLHLPPLTPPGKVKEIAISGDQVCALIHAGFVFCWPLGDDDQILEIPRELFATITAGERHFCGLDATARPICWGADDVGQLDAPDELFAQIAAAATHTCGLDHAGEPICWGRTDADHRDPPSGPFQDIAAGPSHTCAAGAWERSRCWGDNATVDRPFDEPVHNLEVSSDLVCATDTAHRPMCEFGHTAPFELPSPIAVDLAVGHSFACTLDGSGRLECAGPNAPALPPTPPILRAIDANEHTLCAITAWETLMCWDDTGLIVDR